MTDEKKKKIPEPDAALQGVQEYLMARFSKIPQSAKDAIGLAAGSESLLYFELMVRGQYWRERHDKLEAALQGYIRRFFAAVEVAKTCHVRDVGPTDDNEAEQFILEMVKEAMKDLPPVEELPEKKI